MNPYLVEPSTRPVPLQSLGPLPARQVCGNPICNGGLFAFLKDRRRPIFEGRWACSSKCVQMLVQTAVRREAAENAAPSEQYRHRFPMGLIMLRQGWITHAELQRALHAQQQAGSGRIGNWLISECGLNEEHVNRALGLQWQCPVLTTEGFDPLRMALSVPRVLIEQSGIVPLKVVGNRMLYVGFNDHMDAAACFAIERMSGVKVHSGLLTAGQLLEARRILEEHDAIEMTLEHAASPDAITERVTLALVKAQPRAARLVRFHQFYWLRMWLESGAMTSGEGGIPIVPRDVQDRVYVMALPR